MSLSIACPSRIDQVVVYARGAVVTRRVQTPKSWPEGPVDLVVTGISPLAEPGAIRATAAGPRRIVGIQSRLVLPEKAAEGGDRRAKLLELERAASRLETQGEELARRREHLSGLRLRPIVNSRGLCADPSGRFADALASDRLLDELLRALDAQELARERAKEENQRALAAAQAELAQATSAARALPGHPSWEVTVQLAAAAGSDQAASVSPSGGATDVELSYPVAAARWWPAYSARLSSTEDRAELALEAFVAQASFEEWTGVRIGLCTADLTQDTNLPELPSLRIGRAQPAKRTGYRPAPAGLDSLFEPFDESMREVRFEAMSAKKATKRKGEAKTAAGRTQPPEPPPPPPAMPPQPFAVAAAAAPASGMPEGMAAMLVAGPAPAAPPPGLLARQSAMSLSPPKGRAAFRVPALQSNRKGDDARTNTPPPEPSAGGAPESAAPAAVEPADAWLDFDGLTLAPGDASACRGRLVRAATDSRQGLRKTKAAEIENALPVSRPNDPQNARGQFDHRYDADGPVDVPSNAIPHRILLASATAATQRRFRALPREGAEVYREVLLDNPFPAPLLGGPVEVFMDGGLLATPRIDPVGRGGPLALGLGVEDRLRVSRNARVEESSRGMLGGTTGVEHEIDIEVASALGQAIALEVLDRVPVTDDKEAKISLLASEPKAAEYDQADRGAPVRGGLRWNLTVPAGAKAGIKWSYRIDLPAKSEVVGGNRRD